jgi:hypothetical protein
MQRCGLGDAGGRRACAETLRLHSRGAALVQRPLERFAGSPVQHRGHRLGVLGHNTLRPAAIAVAPPVPPSLVVAPATLPPGAVSEGDDRLSVVLESQFGETQLPLRPGLLIQRSRTVKQVLHVERRHPHSPSRYVPARHASTETSVAASADAVKPTDAGQSSSTLHCVRACVREARACALRVVADRLGLGAGRRRR